MQPARQRGKHVKRKSLQLVAPKKRGRSVTSQAVTPRAEIPVVKRYASIRPWLDLARAEFDSQRLRVVEQFPNSQTWPADMLRSLLERPHYAELAGEVLRDLAGRVSSILAALLGPSQSSKEPSPAERIAVAQIERAIHRPIEPIEYFLRALDIAGLKRLRRCAACETPFYAMRLDAQACSRLCATMLRVRRHRARQAQYQQTRKLNQHARQRRRSGAWLQEVKR
jgi:hypothetical protein